MTDRSSTLKVGGFELSVDRDHKGNYRGGQAMSTEFRGWHYHVTHPTLTQEQIFAFLSRALRIMGAVKIDGELYIGVVEATPKQVELWKLNEATTVLWLSGKTGSLHIEANKKNEYAKNILTKPILIKFLKMHETGEFPLELAAPNQKQLF
jgi:hypothetical protein